MKSREHRPAERAGVRAANAAAIAGIQRGLQGMYDGTGEDAEDAFASIERELGIAERA